ncbi:MAG: beta-eliminating lyase-related protein, partial [Actinomycetota bacterium]|nr:beta-eliminating lyase-related protein [Actinomycetota bacterium]
ADVRRHVTPDESHFARTRVVALENTHNRAGGRVFPLELAKDVAATARELGLRVHLDGARLFNAEVATGTPASAWAALCDTVTFCLSKGLGAPAGSLVCGSRARIREVHRARKLLGGGMRQVGILAAAGLHALDHHVERLALDHDNARTLAHGLAGLPGVEIEPAEVATNIVIFRVADAQALCTQLAVNGVIMGALDERTVRAVTHLDVGAEDIATALEAVGSTLAAA